MSLTSFVFDNDNWLEADLISVVIPSGQVIRATNHNVDLVGPDGFTYSAMAFGKWERGAINYELNTLTTCSVKVTADTTVLFPGTTIPLLWLGKLLARSRVTITVATIAPNAPTTIVGSVVVFVGRVTAPSIVSTQATLTCSDESYVMGLAWPQRVICSGCPFTLFDRGCTLNKASFAISCAVGAGSTSTNIVLGKNRNQILWSQDFTNAAWSSTTVVTSNTAVAPDGTTTADTLNDNSASASLESFQQITVPADSNSYTVSIYVQKTSAATNTFGLNLTLFGGTSVGVTPRLNTNTGVSTFSTAVDAGLYWRLIATVTNNGTNTALQVAVFPASGVNSGSNPGTDVVTATGTATVWGVQAELGTVATAYTPTTAAPTLTLGTIGNDSLPYTKGYLVATSGQATGWPIMVTTQIDTSTISIQPFPIPLAVGDAFTLFPGCVGTESACEFKYNNRQNYGGFLSVPGPPSAIVGA